MTKEEKIQELERMFKNCPEILTPMKASRFAPIGKNGIYELIKKKELRAFNLPPPTDFAQWLKNEWSTVNELLRLDEVAVITGYALSSVQKWTYKKRLPCTCAQAKVLTTKEWLIEFFVEHGHRIIRKSDIHLQLLHKFYSPQ